MLDSVPWLQAVAHWAFVVGVVCGAIALAAGAIVTVASNRAGAIATREAGLKIEQAREKASEADARAADANKRAEEAKADAAKTNERLQKMQEARRLSKIQIDALDNLFRSDVFQKPEPKRLRVASVEDAEARMFAMEFQKLLESCGVQIYPTDRGFPRTCVQLNPEATPLVLTVQSGDVNPEMQHLAHFERTMLSLGFDMGIEYDPSLLLGEGVLYVMRKAAT